MMAVYKNYFDIFKVNIEIRKNLVRSLFLAQGIEEIFARLLSIGSQGGNRNDSQKSAIIKVEPVK
jgi:hypothetical protein